LSARTWSRRAPRSSPTSRRRAALLSPLPPLTQLPQVRDTIFSENDANLSRRRAPRERSGAPTLDSAVAALQRDPSSYCEAPADAAFPAFLAAFELEANAEAVACVLRGNAFMSELHSRIVPLVVDDTAFWARYFFRLRALQAAFAQPAEAEVPAETDAEAGTEQQPEAVEASADAAGEVAAEEAPEEETEAGGASDSSWSLVTMEAGSAAEAADAQAADEPPASPVSAPLREEADEPRTPGASRLAGENEGTPSPSPLAGGADAGEEVDEDWGLE